MIRTLFAIAALFTAGALFAEEKEGGIIGTGVIGQITGLGQFEVSGMQFGFAADLELKGVSGLEDLRMGMTLALSTGRDGSAWKIQTLQHVPLLTGPVTAPGEVMGVPVAGALPAFGNVEVNGFWSETGIVASLISEGEDDAAQVTGVYDGQGRVGQLSIQGVDLGSFEAGQPLTVSGKFVDGALVADTVMPGPFMGAAPDLLLLEGFFQPIPETGSLSLQGIALTSMAAEAEVDPGELVRRCAVNGRTDFERSALSPHDVELVNSFCISAAN